MIFVFLLKLVVVVSVLLYVGKNGSRCILGKKGNFRREYSSVCALDANDARDNDTNDAKELSYSRMLK